jgi:hypothetical protein
LGERGRRGAERKARDADEERAAVTDQITEPAA